MEDILVFIFLCITGLTGIALLMWPVYLLGVFIYALYDGLRRLFKPDTDPKRNHVDISGRFQIRKLSNDNDDNNDLA